MLSLVGEMQHEGLLCGDQSFPAEVDFMISAMEAAPCPLHDRREARRTRYRVRAALRLFSDAPESASTLLYTRSVSAQAIGFLTDRRLPLSHGGVIRMTAPDGSDMQIYCTILRCREVAPGWFEGAAYFNRQQHCFAAGEMAE